MSSNLYMDSYHYGRCLNCGAEIKSNQKYCQRCGKLVNSWQPCGTDRCGNCHEKLNPEDRYCRYCGTKVGEGKFEPFQNLMQCIYGPMPIERTHKCRRCGYSWTSCEMIDRQTHCPKCGGTVSTYEKR